MEEKELSQQESLELINSMISKAKNEIHDNGLEWLIWGGMIFLAAISTYIFIEVDYRMIFLGWNIFGIVAITLLIYDFVRPQKKLHVRTYVDDLLRLFDIGFMISIFIIIISINISRNPNVGFGYFLMVYAFLMLIQGGALRFKPLIIGAVVNWLGAIAIFINNDFKYDMLITAAAVFIGYIIPGYLLLQQHKRKMKHSNTDTQYGI